jgi:hypothetical protein
LSEINRINGQGRVALAHIRREREAAEALFSELTRLSDIAEASAAMASSATQACIAARAALDGADEIEAEDTVEPPAEAPAEGTAAEATAAGASAAGDSADAARPVEALPVAAPVAEPLSPPAAASPPVEAEPQVPATEASAPAADADSSPTAPSSPSTPAALTAGDISRATDWMVVDIRAPDPQTITRLMRREGRTLSILVDRLAGNEPSARSYWQLLLSNFVDSVVASAIGEGYLEFPKGSPFWDQFSRSEVREVARGLTALGFSFDGFGAFADGRVPTRRDLALAVGAAGLLPVRIRHWPNPDEAALLFQGVRASADAFIAVKAPALTLGELVRALGRRAEPLANLWNEWARVRPLLFATDL